MSNRQLALNISANIVAFAISAGISFFLTPYIVRSLGTAAYGFIGLSSSIISYTSLITVALNAMAGRFVSLAYMRGDVRAANGYFSSVFYANTVLAAFIFLLAVFFIAYIEKIIDVPRELLADVRLLFSILVANSLIGLVTNIYNVSTFITNKLYLSSIRGIISNFIGVAVIISAFGFFAPHVWYVGLSGLATTLYWAFTNKKLRDRLTPDLRVKPRNFDFAKVAELIKSGAWNVINKLSNILSQGLDLLFANIFVGAASMGMFSISKTVPMMALTLMGSIAGVFAPQLTAYYAEGKTNELVSELHKSIRVVSCFSTPILCSLYLFSGDFYRVWLPGQDWRFLWLLTVLGFVASPFTMPQEGLWNVFTITNKLKYSSLTLLGESIGVFSTILISMIFVKDPGHRLIVLACTRTVWGFVRSSTFLPMYSAHCLGCRLTTFYHYILKSVLGLAIACGLVFLLRQFSPATGWGILIIDVGISCVIGFACNYYIVMTKHDREYLLSKIPIRINH